MPGDAALRAMAHELPALVVLDVMMASVLDGLDLARRLSADAALARIPIVMVSSMPDSAWPGLFPTDEYLPIDAWLSKPVRPQEPGGQIRALLPRTPLGGQGDDRRAPQGPEEVMTPIAP